MPSRLFLVHFYHVCESEHLPKTYGYIFISASFKFSVPLTLPRGTEQLLQLSVGLNFCSHHPLQPQEKSHAASSPDHTHPKSYLMTIGFQGDYMRSDNCESDIQNLNVAIIPSIQFLCLPILVFKTSPWLIHPSILWISCTFRAHHFAPVKSSQTTSAHEEDTLP